MEKIKKEIPFLVLTLLPFGYLAAIWKQLPLQVPMHWNGSGEIDRYGDKSELIVTIFMLVGLTYLLFLFLPNMDPKQKIQKMGAKWQNLRFLLTLFMSALAIFILYSVQQKSSNPSVVFILIGLLFTVLGNYFKTVPSNYFIGIRTPWTLESESVWKKTHQLAGKLWFVGGLAIIATSLLTSNWQFYTFIGITIVITIVPIVYSYRFFSEENATNV